MMAAHPITQQPQSEGATFKLLPGEYVRFEYRDNPGCCWFSSRTTIVTNIRLITRIVKPARICSKQTSSGEERITTMFLTDIQNRNQIHSAIPASRLSCWRRCLEILTCSCADQNIDWLNSCREVRGDVSSCPPSSHMIEKF